MGNLIGLRRREFLVTSAAAMSAMRSLSGASMCQLTSEQEEGPYYAQAAALRSDVREGKPGVPVRLRVALVN
jgi:hypothetical protein